MTGVSRSLLLALALLPAAAGAQSFDELMAKGRAQLDSAKANDAVKSFEKAIKANPQSSDAHLWLGRALGTVAASASVLRQPFLAKRAKSEFDKAVELDPKSVGGREGLMQFYLRAPGMMGGSIAKAREQAAIIASVSPYRGHFANVAIASNQKDLAGMEQAWRAVVTEFPDSLGGVTNLASFLSNNGRGDEAFPLLDNYLAKHPDDIVAQFWIGRIAGVTGKQLDRGERMLTALLTHPMDKGPRILRENIHFRLGEIAAKRGDKAAARAAYGEALKINPNHEPSKRGLAAVK